MSKIAAHDKTREGWLRAAVQKLEARLEQAGQKMPEAWAVSVGFPKRAHAKVAAIGECWSKEVSTASVYEMFISPVLENPVEVLATLLHEMIHAAVGLECKHAGPFAKTARAVGLKGKLTATYAEPGTELHDALTDLSRELGDYPHKAMAPRKKPAQPKGWFLVKLVSPNDPGYKFTIAPRLIEEYGMPKDFLGDEMIVAEE
ncbi:hypothetical protein [Pseudomonas phage Psa21-HRN]|nr:hypothetical protein [Pseudomonas phage Psa21-HRN]